MTQALNTARALIRILTASPYAELHLRREGFEIFLARKEGGRNPMRRPAEPPPLAAAPEEALQAPEAKTLSAPHAASLIWTAPLGAALQAGETAARLELLGEEIEIRAQEAGRVTQICAAPGDLLDHAAPVLRIL